MKSGAGDVADVIIAATGVIGTGSTAVQIVSDLVHKAGKVSMFQRTAQCRANLETVRDPELRARLTPDYRAAFKRLVLATGFRPDRFIRPARVFGRNGVELDDYWAKRPLAYLSVSIPEFPNFFMLNGPNGPVGNFSLIDIAELQFACILQLVEVIASRRCRELSPTQSATEAFEIERVEAAKNTIWATGCCSWYLDDRGIPASWPFTFDRFHAEMAAPKLEAFELV